MNENSGTFGSFILPNISYTSPPAFVPNNTSSLTFTLPNYNSYTPSTFVPGNPDTDGTNT